MAKQLKMDVKAMGQLEEMLSSYGPAQVVDALRELFVGWAETACDGIEMHDKEALRAAETEADRLRQASDMLKAALPTLRRVGL